MTDSSTTTTPWRHLLHSPEPGARLMGILNVSPESFYGGSVARGRQAIRDACERMAAEGAHLIDIGAMSTAPYKETQISEQQEAERIHEAITAAREATQLPISADTTRSFVAGVALDAGADAINDVTGLHGDKAMASLVGQRRCGVVLMANAMQLPEPTDEEEPAKATIYCLRRCLEIASGGGIEWQDICLDPGVGFFRGRRVPWHEWDMVQLRNMDQFRGLGYPLALSASRKSFIGHLLGRPSPDDRLAGSLAIAIHAAKSGVRLIRTHDVAQTRDALAMAELLDPPPYS